MPLNAIENGLSTLARMETMVPACSTCKHSIVPPQDVVVRDQGGAVWGELPCFHHLPLHNSHQASSHMHNFWTQVQVSL